MLILIAFCGAVCFLGFTVYLGRVLRHLDPSQAIPGRVRSALDSLTEGLLVIDPRQSVVLANQALVKLVGRSNEQLMGTPIDALAWRDAGGRPLPPAGRPWSRALSSRRLASVSAGALAPPRGAGAEGAARVVRFNAPGPSSRRRRLRRAAAP